MGGAARLSRRRLSPRSNRHDRTGGRAALAELIPAASGRAAARSDVCVDNGWTADLDPADRRHRPAHRARAARRSRAPHGSLLGYRHESYDCDRTAAPPRQLSAAPRRMGHPRPRQAGARHGARPPARRSSAALIAASARTVGSAIGAACRRDASEALGAPAADRTVASAASMTSRVEITLVLRDKPANRMPEAGLSVTHPGRCQPAGQLLQDGPLATTAHSIAGAGRRTAAGRRRRAAQGWAAAQLDCNAARQRRWSRRPTAPFMPFEPDVADLRQGLRFNLYNNKWGTNFPMWWEGTRRLPGRAGDHRLAQQRLPAVDIDGHAGHVPRGIRGEEGDDIGHVLAACPACRR